MNNAAAMSNTRARTLNATVLSALEQAFECRTVAAARCCLETALDGTRQLADGGRLTERLQLQVNETRLALAARGWTV